MYNCQNKICFCTLSVHTVHNCCTLINHHDTPPDLVDDQLVAVPVVLKLEARVGDGGCHREHVLVRAPRAVVLKRTLIYKQVLQGY